MKLGSSALAASVAASALICASSPSYAFVAQIPEPSVMSVYGLALAGLVIAYRLRNRK